MAGWSAEEQQVKSGAQIEHKTGFDSGLEGAFRSQLLEAPSVKRALQIIEGYAPHVGNVDMLRQKMEDVINEAASKNENLKSYRDEMLNKLPRRTALKG